MKKNKGITIISLIIVIVILFIITGTSLYSSMNRFKINELNKMYTDIDLLKDKVSSYYIQYGGIPVLRNEENNAVEYTFSELNFQKNINDDGIYYILDLEVIGNVTLNFGERGFRNPNRSNDVYIINNKTHEVYYVKGVQLSDGILYHSRVVETEFKEDNVPPTRPEIKIISQEESETGIYTSGIELEIIEGKDNISGINKTTYSINSGEEIDIKTLNNNILKLEEEGTYQVKVRSHDNNGNASDYSIKNIKIISIEKGDFIKYNVEYTDMYISKTYNTKNGWRLLDYTDNGNGTYSNVKIISTGIPAKLYYYNSDTTNNNWFITDETKLANFREFLGGNEFGFFTGTYDYIGLKAGAGLYYNFANIKFAYSTEKRGYNLGYFKSIVNNGTNYNSNTTTEITGGNLFLTGRSDITVRLSTITEMNRLLMRADIDSKTSITDSEDPAGIYKINILKNITGMNDYVYSNYYYWLGSPHPNPGSYMTSASYVSYLYFPGTLGGSINGDHGVRPVICFSNDVQFVDEDQDGILEIK